MNYRITFNRIAFIGWSTIAVIFFMCSITPNNEQAEFLFIARIDYDVGASSVAIGDLNGNSDLELVTDGV